jgi:hypothetical protein
MPLSWNFPNIQHQYLPRITQQQPVFFVAGYRINETRVFTKQQAHFIPANAPPVTLPSLFAIALITLSMP